MSEWTYCAGCNAPIMPKDGRWIIASGLYPVACFATADGLHAPSLPKPDTVTLPRWQLVWLLLQVMPGGVIGPRRAQDIARAAGIDLLEEAERP